MIGKQKKTEATDPEQLFGAANNPLVSQCARMNL
jgi:hypothetical protein